MKYEEMMVMPDGVRLRTIFYRPNTDKAVSTIIMRTCYPQNDKIYRETAEEYCNRGFAFVYQYCRGTGGSEGNWEPNVNERMDGSEMLQRICEQQWVKNAGYFGCSYLALTGWVVADILPEKVKTMYLTHYGTFRYTSAYKDGLFRHDVLTSWAMENAGFEVNADYLESCRYMPHVEVDEKMWGKKIEWYRKWITSTSRSDQYWDTGFWKMLREIPSKVKVPIYIGEGWYDHHLGSAIETYRALSEKCKNRSRLVIGAWDHGFNIKVDGYKNGGHFENNDNLRAFEWFYNILVKEEIPKGSIDTYVIGDDSWYSREKYEITGQNELVLYLGNGSEEKYLGLLEEKQDRENHISYIYNPDNPIMTHGAESLLKTSEEQGSLLQPDAGYRDDVISFVSKPFDREVTVMGKMSVHLEVSTDAEDTAFSVKIIEIMPDKRAYNMRTGITTLGYLGGRDERAEYKPGSKVTAVIDMWDLAWKIQKGSRLRVDISSSDFPQYAVHSNYPGVWSEQRKNKVAIQTIYFGGSSPSCVRLPVI